MNFPFKNNSFQSYPARGYLEGLYNARAIGPTPLDAGLKSFARAQLELWALANRRARANLALPAQLAACRTPQDAVAAYADFWQSAFVDCAESTRRITQAASNQSDSADAAGEPSENAFNRIDKASLNGVSAAGAR